MTQAEANKMLLNTLQLLQDGGYGVTTTKQLATYPLPAPTQASPEAPSVDEKVKVEAVPVEEKETPKKGK